MVVGAFRKKSDFESPPDSDSIVLICVMRDESLVLDAFIKHYKKLMVSHYIFIDNGSQDDSLDILHANINNIDYQLWDAYGRYSANNFGLSWVNFILETEVRDLWCLVVDLDEFLVLERHANLAQLASGMNEQNCNVLQGVLVEFYPKDFLNVEPYEKGESPFRHSSFYDKFTHEFLSVIRPHGKIDFRIEGGIRKRTTCDSDQLSPVLNKNCFFKNIFYAKCSLGPGMHFFNWKKTTEVVHSNRFLCRKFKPYGRPQVLAHFKYLRPNIEEYFALRIERNEDWDQSSEYRKYVSNGPILSFYHDGLSRQFSSGSQLYADTLKYLFY